MATKVFFYTLRPYDELGIAQRLAPQMDIEFGYSQDYPTLENAELAKGYDAVSVTPCDMSASMVKRFHALGIKAICCRSIGYDHVDRETARALGMKVANVDYPPNGVANFAIMLMLMSLRKAGHILKRGEAQDYSLKGKIGRDISGCTVGVIGTGRIGRTVLPPAGLRPVPERGREEDRGVCAAGNPAERVRRHHPAHQRHRREPPPDRRQGH